MSTMTCTVNTAVAEAMNRYGAGLDRALHDRGLLWEIDHRGVLRGAVPPSCSTVEALERLVLWAAALNLVLLRTNPSTPKTYTYRGVVDHRVVEVWNSVLPREDGWLFRALTEARPADSPLGV
ncbi:hypothetical protein ACFV4N_33535 [Actinosynnema sp. NPDC059797]